MARRYLLFIACVAVLATQGSSQPQACTTASWGDTTSTPYPLKPNTMSPGVREWVLNIDGHPKCPLELATGAEATVCEYDSPPVVKFVDQFHLQVHRTGSTQQLAGVIVTLYCSA